MEIVWVVIMAQHQDHVFNLAQTEIGIQFLVLVMVFLFLLFFFLLFYFILLFIYLFYLLTSH